VRDVKQWRKRLVLALAATAGLLAAVALVVLIQRLLAAQVGGMIATAWLSTMGALASILGVFFGN
jgi:uncharacterized YccA/Bax inhibitor family protein